MWLSKDEYTKLVVTAAKAETRADWLLVQVNQLQHDLGIQKSERTGQPVAVPMYVKEATPPPSEQAETSFEDMGDVQARVHGVDWDDYGRVAINAG